MTCRSSPAKSQASADHGLRHLRDGFWDDSVVMQDLFKKFLSRPSSASAIHYVIVGIGAETFGVPASQIQEIIGLGDMDPMP